MFCGSCGSAVNDGLSFCPNCGAPVIAEGAQPVPQPGPQPVVQNFQANTVQQPIVLSQAQEVRENGFAIAGIILGSMFLIAGLGITFSN